MVGASGSLLIEIEQGFQQSRQPILSHVVLGDQSLQTVYYLFLTRFLRFFDFFFCTRYGTLSEKFFRCQRFLEVADVGNTSSYP